MPRNFCQNPLCHLDNTKDRLKKGKYRTRKALSSWYNYFCTQQCFHQYFDIYKNQIINFIGLKTQPSIRNENDPSFWSRCREIHNRPDYNWQTTNTNEIVYRELNQN